MRISIHDFRGIADLDAAIDGILLVAGQNGAGKSSACAAIAACLTGDLLPFQGVTKAKAALLVRDGGASASATLTGPDGGASVIWPSCERAEKGRAPWASPVAAGLVNPLAMDAKARAGWLIDLIGAMPASEAVGEALGNAKVPVVEAAQLWTVIETRGWDAAHAEAKETGAKLKGQWERVTGARYGSAKAAAWRPDGWRSGLDALGIAELESAAATAHAAAERIRRESLIGEGERRRLEEAVIARQRALSERDHAKGYSLAAANALRAAQDARGALGPIAAAALECPCCRAALVMIRGKLAAAPETPTDAATLAAADRTVAEAERDARAKQEHYQRLLREIEAGAEADEKLQAMGDVADPAAVARIKAAADETGVHLRMKRQAVEATELHERITRQVEIVKLLAEDGLRQQVLTAALAGLAAELLEVTRAADWRPVTVDADMSVAYGGRPVSLCSAGEQYRARCALQLVAARRDGSALVILDGADILDREGRNGIMRALRGLPAVIGMTMRREDVPPPLLASGRAVWIGDAPERRAA